MTHQKWCIVQPKAGDKFTYDNYEIEILEADARRVGKIKVSKKALLPKEEQE